MFASKDLIFAKKASGSYAINNSLRFRSSASAGFIKTSGYPTPTNTSKWTLSMWVKRGAISYNYAGLAGHTISASANFALYFDNTDKLSWTFNNTNFTTTAQVFRDPSAWYHFVFVWDSANATAANRARIYVNGVEITSYSTDNRANITTAMDCWNTTNTTYASGIGANSASVSTITAFFDGYIAEVYNIDGQTLTPSSFGKTDTVTGVWVPISYTGTYGGAGFYFKFSDIAATSGTNVGFGKDLSGNGNFWNTQNFSTTAGVTYDAMVDSPTNSAAASNYAVLNPVAGAASGASYVLSNGNLTAVLSSSSNMVEVPATIGISSGLWYWEVTVTSVNTTYGFPCAIGISSNGGIGNAASFVSNYYYYNNKDGKFQNNSITGTTYGATYTTNDVIGIAFNANTGTLTFYKNGTSQGVASSSIPAGLYWPKIGSNDGCTVAANFGQRPFTYTPPSGFVALNTQNLPTPTIANGAQYMAATTYNGNSTVQNVVNLGSFQPDFVWIKCRSSAYDNILNDAVRGAGNYLVSNTTAANVNNTIIFSAFNSDGFQVNNAAQTNATGQTYVAWQWKANGAGSSNTSGSITSTVSANVSAGFSVVTYTGTGANATVGHGLGAAPSMVIVKQRTASSTTDWAVWHTSLANTEYLLLDTTAAKATGATYWNSTTPDSSKFAIGTAAAVNASSSATYVAYCFAPVAGYSAFGSYTGNGSADGPFVFTGFRPRWIMWKRTDTTSSWFIYDTSRSTYNVMGLEIYPNTSDAEAATTRMDFLSNGFKLRAANAADNASGGTYIYAAFAENPLKYSLAR